MSAGLVASGGSIFYYGWGEKLAPQQLRDRFESHDIPEDEGKRLQLFRRFYPRTMSNIDRLPDSLIFAEFSLPDNLANEIGIWMVEDGLYAAGLLTEEELRQMQALEGEVMHFALEQAEKRVKPPKVNAPILPKKESEPTPETEQWLKENFPRAWEFVTNIGIITSEKDFRELRDSLLKLFLAGQTKEHWKGTDKMDDYFELAEAEHIAIAMLYNNKRIPPKKHWWS